MAVFAAIRGQHLCVPDPYRCCRRGGKTSEVRENICVKVEQAAPLCRAAPERRKRINSIPVFPRRAHRCTLRGCNCSWKVVANPICLSWVFLEHGIYCYNSPCPSSQQSLPDNRVAAERQASLWGTEVMGCLDGWMVDHNRKWASSHRSKHSRMYVSSRNCFVETEFRREEQQLLKGSL